MLIMSGCCAAARAPTRPFLVGLPWPWRWLRATPIQRDAWRLAGQHPSIERPWMSDKVACFPLNTQRADKPLISFIPLEDRW